MSSVRSIARQAGVSITTVSRALNNDPAVNAKTRESVLRIANECGYVATIGRRVTTNIGFAYTQNMTLSDPFDAALLHGVNRGVGEARFDLLVVHLKRDKEPGLTYTQLFRRKGIRGVLLRTTEETRHICHEIAAEDFPHVVIAERFDDDGVSCIDCDSKADSFRAVEYLFALGHRRVAFAMHNIPDRDHLDRFDGYRQALASRGQEVDKSLVFRHRATVSGGATIMNMLVSMRDRPTAIYIADPIIAIGLVNQAQALGVRIPEDLSVVGFDDSELRHQVYPALTAVCQDAVRLGFEAALALTRMLGGSSPGVVRKTIPTFFEVNHSTAPPNGQRLWDVRHAAPQDANEGTPQSLAAVRPRAEA